MLYVVLATGRPGETGVEERFFQAQKQAQSFTVWFGKHSFHRLATPPTLLTFDSTLPDAVFTLGSKREGLARRPVAR
jgi:hypothetical protein